MAEPVVTVKWQEATAEYEVSIVHAPASGTVLHCGCCGLPWATVTPDGVLVVESRHSGRVHENRLSVAALAALAAGTNGANGANGATNGETWGYSG